MPEALQCLGEVAEVEGEGSDPVADLHVFLTDGNNRFISSLRVFHFHNTDERSNLTTCHCPPAPTAPLQPHEGTTSSSS